MGGVQAGLLHPSRDIDGLAPDTEYTYQLGSASAGWSSNHTFRTGPGAGDFDFIFVGDPQMGTSGDLETETAQWQRTLDSAWEMYPQAQLLVSAGDQVDQVVFAADREYTAFKTPEQLTRYPLATTLGNHDIFQLAYGDHFNLPNHDGSSGAIGGHYHYTYHDTLFIHLNANDVRHQTLVDYTRAVMAENPATWTIVTFHHSIYSVAPHATDPDAEDLGIIEGRRTVLSRGLSEAGVDLVLMGHDHYYTRTPLVNRGEMVDGPDEDVTTGPSFLVPGEGDVLYLTGNSASGSKYYGRNSALPEPAPWGEVENQEQVANFTRVNVGTCGLTMSTYRSDARTLVDEVMLSGDHTDPELTVPADATITVGDDFDALAGVSAVDDCDEVDVEVAGTVDTGTPGEYSLTYTSTDRSGNTATATRTVTVLAAEVTPPADDTPPTDDPVDETSGADGPDGAGDQPNTDPATDDPREQARPVTATGDAQRVTDDSTGRSADRLADTGAPVGAAAVVAALAAIGTGTGLVLRRRNG